jgi:toxin-antitoxin system PIN domain toxin
VRAVLLDINVLIALHWPAHEHFDAAHSWFAASIGGGRWATCPLTQLGFVRIVSNPSFSPDALAPADAIELLARNLAHPAHEFWADDMSLTDAAGPLSPRLQGHRQMTDSYLLGLARKHRGALASFDTGLRSLAGAEYLRALEIVPARPPTRSGR